MDVSVLVVSYNTADLLADCLRSIEASVEAESLEVIVVDNASTDGSAEVVRGGFPHMRLIPLSENVGFARACNLAEREALGDYLFLVNPDAAVHELAISRLVAFARANPEHGIYGGRVLDPEGTPRSHSCWGFPGLWSLVCFATGLSTAFPRSRLLDPESLGSWQRDTVREVDVVTGCLMLVERTIWRTLGGFDPRYFVYGEDLDLCRRAWDAGWRPVIVPGAVITHHEAGSSPDPGHRMSLILRGKLTYLRLHGSALARYSASGLYQAGAALRALLGSATWRTVWRERRDWSFGYPGVEERGQPTMRIAPRSNTSTIRRRVK